MASNEDRAKLCGWKFTPHYGWQYKLADGWHPCPSYDTSLDACAELRAFVRARGKIKRFQLELWNVVLGCVPLFEPSYEQEFNLLDATPQQLCAAFDATFKDELEKIQ